MLLEKIKKIFSKLVKKKLKYNIKKYTHKYLFIFFEILKNRIFVNSNHLNC